MKTFIFALITLLGVTLGAPVAEARDKHRDHRDRHSHRDHHKDHKDHKYRHHKHDHRHDYSHRHYYSHPYYGHRGTFYFGSPGLTFRFAR